MKVLLKKNMAGPGFNILAGNVVEVPDVVALGNLDKSQEKLPPAERSAEYELKRDPGLIATGQAEKIKKEDITALQTKNFHDLTAHFTPAGMPKPNEPRKKAATGSKSKK